MSKVKTAKSPDGERFDLIRGLGPWASAAVVVGTMIGTGVFLVPSTMARNAGSVGLVFLVWILGGVLTLFGALSYAEMGAAIPEAGGDYAYLHRGFGPRCAYMFGWMHTIVGRPASAAAIAAGLMRFSGFLFPILSHPVITYPIWLPFRTVPYNFVITPAQPMAVTAIGLITIVNYLGVRLGGRVQVFLTALKIGAVLAVVVFGLALGHGTTKGFTMFPPGAMGLRTVGGFLAAMVAALWAYDGWNDLSLMGSEVSNPQKNIPRALAGGVLFVGVIYLLTNAVYFYILPFVAVAHSTSVASDAVATFAGFSAAKWLTVAMMVSALGTLNASLMSGARVPYAMSRDNRFFKFAGEVHPKFRTPGGALVLQAYLAGALALTGTFDELFSLFIFAQWVFYGLVAAAVIALRRREPDLPRPYRTWGYPYVPVVFCIGAVAVTIASYMEQPVRSTIGLVFILLGLAFYKHWQTPKDARPAAGEGAA